MSCFKHTSNISYEEMHFEWEFPDNFLLSEMATAAPIKSDTLSFAKGSWILMVERGYFNYMDLYIGNVGCNNEIDVGYEIGLKKVDGSVEQFYTNRHDFMVGLLYCTRRISKSELLEREHELAPPHGLTITCTLRRGTSHYHQQAILHQVTPPALIKLEILSENFKSLFDDEASCDVILQVKDKEFHAHKAVLMVRSPEFAAIFQHDTLEKQTNIINIPDCDPESFDEFLQFLYCGKLEDITFRSAFYLFCTSHKYGVQELKTFCIEYMERCLEEDNVCDVAELADVYEEEKLLEAVQNFFNKNAKLEILSENFKSLFDDEDSCDVILQVKDKEFHAHKAVLMVRSPEFAAIFQHDTSEKQTNIINIPDCDPESFDEFLQFLYCGKLEDITFRSAFYLFCTSHKYGVQELKTFCIEYMERCLEEDNVCDVAELAYMYEEERLLEAVQNFFNKNASSVLDTDEWDTLLRNNYCLAKRIIKGMASKVKIED